MSKFAKVATIACALSIACVGTVQAQDADRAVKARQSLMQLYAHYLGTLGGMAKGEIEYNAEAAGTAATSLAALASVDQSAMWPQGSDTEALGEKTAALPAIWTTYPAVVEKGQAFGQAAQAMAEVAGNDLDSLKAAMGDLGASCGGCHKEFRLKRD